MTAQSMGTVKWFNPEKAYGFIVTDNGQDVFVHRSAIADGRAFLVDGQGVEFQLREGMKGLEADAVYVTEDVAIPEHRLRSLPTERTSYGNAPRSFGNERSFRDRPERRPRESYDGPVPQGPVEAKVVRIDPAGRFMFVRLTSLGADVYVHSSLFARLHADLQPHDVVTVEVEHSERGLRARSLR